VSSIDRTQKLVAAPANPAYAAQDTPTGEKDHQAPRQSYPAPVLIESMDNSSSDTSDAPGVPPWSPFLTATEGSV
jgi:hypothetical protein